MTQLLASYKNLIVASGFYGPHIPYEPHIPGETVGPYESESSSLVGLLVIAALFFAIFVVGPWVAERRRKNGRSGSSGRGHVQDDINRGYGSDFGGDY